MPYGYNGRILHVDLSQGSTWIEEPSEAWYRRYLGGRGIGAFYLLKELAPNVEPLSAENLLIFAASVVTGLPFPGNARASVVAKSPLTGGFGEAEAGGNWGPELKFAGFDAVVIRGRAPRPVYLWLHDGEVEIRDASFLWGLTTRETTRRLQAELGDDRIKVACIGPAGERLVRYACISAGPHDVFGRTGLGAVMGAKNLKAVAVRGAKKPAAFAPERIREISRWVAANFKRPETCQLFYDYGTSGAVNLYNAMGALPGRNFRDGTIEGAERLSGEYMLENGLITGRTRCFACPISCRKIARIDEPGRFNTDGEVHSPEYETIGALGSNCGLNDPRAVIKAAQLCDDYGIDTISAGGTIAFAMECAERGLLAANALGDDVPLEFGNAEAVLRCLELIARREGLGDLLAEGSKRMALKLGGGALAFAVQAKGEELAVQDPRGGKIGAALGYAVGPLGGDHIQMEHDFLFATPGPALKSLEPLGVLEPVPAMSLEAEKVRLFILNQKLWSLYNMLDLCIFVPAPAHTLPLKYLEDLVAAATGWQTSLYELLEAGERGLVMARVFNLREGFTAADDTVPQRLLEPLQNGAAKGTAVDAEALAAAVRMYYSFMGWEEGAGVPHEGTLRRLGLDWLVPSLRLLKREVTR